VSLQPGQGKHLEHVPGVKGATSNRLSSVTKGDSLSSRDKGWPMPPAAPTTATLQGLSPNSIRPVALTGEVTVSIMDDSIEVNTVDRRETATWCTKAGCLAAMSKKFQARDRDTWVQASAQPLTLELWLRKRLRLRLVASRGTTRLTDATTCFWSWTRIPVLHTRTVGLFG
jgi:hypothetical protein